MLKKKVFIDTKLPTSKFEKFTLININIPQYLKAPNELIKEIFTIFNI